MIYNILYLIAKLHGDQCLREASGIDSFVDATLASEHSIFRTRSSQSRGGILERQLGGGDVTIINKAMWTIYDTVDVV